MLDTDLLEILLVDDIKDNLLALNALLARDDVRILQVQSGPEALELMMVHDFCLVLLDIQMPGMNGFEVAELMRGSNKTKHIPIIFVTAASKDERYVFKGYESGAVDFLRKPLDPHMVKSKVSIFLELHEQKKLLINQVKELDRTKKELELAVKVREEFMSIAGHELKTPLTSLTLQSQMRKRSLEKNNMDHFSAERLAKMFDADNKQLIRLNRLIDDMLDISRINTGKFSIELESFDLHETIYDLVERNSDLFKNNLMTIIVDQENKLIVKWDKIRIEQVLTNLLTNAIRYGQGKPIEITVKSEEDRAIILVRDHGIGIPEKDLSRIFQKFERATETEARGLGLGLYIVGQIVEAHQGELSVTSVFGEGSEFKVSIPVNA